MLRDELDLKGTKYACGVALCGSCTVHVDDEAVRSCAIPVSRVEGKRITTIEALAQGAVLHPVQQAWLDAEVPQCGYCHPGIIMAVAEMLAKYPNPSDAQIDEVLTIDARCAGAGQRNSGGDWHAHSLPAARQAQLQTDHRRMNGPTSASSRSTRIWLVSFMHDDLGFFDDETCRLEPVDNPFQAQVSPMSPA